MRVEVRLPAEIKHAAEVHAKNLGYPSLAAMLKMAAIQAALATQASLPIPQQAEHQQALLNPAEALWKQK